VRDQLFGNNLNTSKFFSGINYEETEIKECLLSISAEYFVSQFAAQKFKN